jgi:hypothetical protein
VAGLAALGPAPDPGPGLLITGLVAAAAVAPAVMFDDLVDLFRAPAQRLVER